MSDMRFAGLTVIVTGAGSGIGRATALRICAEGGRVIASDVDAERLTALVAENPGADLVTVAGDASDPAVVEAIAAAAGPEVYGLVNNAGIMDTFQPIGEVDDAVWDRVFAVNVDAVMRLSRAVVPAMLASGRGSVVNVASEASLRGSGAGVAYTASKHAVVGITKSSAVMYARKGIRFNAIAPGAVATNIVANFASALGGEVLGPLLGIIPAMGQPDQLAAAICFVLSPEADFVNGAVLPVDAGWSAI